VSVTSRITLGNGLNVDSNIRFVSKKSQLPSPSSGLIQLADNTTYFILTTIDLTGDRLVGGQNSVIIGGSSENCRLKSTGLTGNALITSNYTLPIRHITIEAAIALDLDASANSDQALDWLGVNFTDCVSCGTIKGYDNFILKSAAFLNSGELTFDGSFDTIAFETTLFDTRSTKTSIVLPSTLTVNRRFRIIYSSFVVESGETGINASDSMTIPNEGYILDTVDFSGDGTYITGVTTDDNKARIDNCRGIDNSANIAQYYFTSNATTTTISTQGTFVKVAGTTSAGDFIEKFDVTTTSNKATFEGSRSGFYKVTAVLSISGGNNKVVCARIAKNGTTSAQSQTCSTTNAGGRSENVVCQNIQLLDTDDYIEVFIANDTDTSNFTVEDINVTIERLN